MNTKDEDYYKMNCKYSFSIRQLHIKLKDLIMLSMLVVHKSQNGMF